MFALAVAAAVAAQPSPAAQLVTYRTLVVYSTAACSTFMVPEARRDLDIEQYPEPLRVLFQRAKDRGFAIAPHMTRDQCGQMIAEVRAMAPRH